MLGLQFLLNILRNAIVEEQRADQRGFRLDIAGEADGLSFLSISRYQFQFGHGP
jgi:hypothetical protein